MRALVLCDDYYHPARVVRAGLAPLAGRGWSFDWVERADDWSPERLRGYPALILSKMNQIAADDSRPWLSEEGQAAFTAYLRQGNGLLAIHSGTAGYAERPELRRLMGGAFARHPPQCPVTVEARAGHRLGAGCEPFTLVDEHYFMELDDPAADVFMTATSEHGAQPAGWTRAEGAGRVCVLTPGHNLEVWLHPSYQAVIANALDWCAGRGAA
jgi:type 1 glutamine amidotransferase